MQVILTWEEYQALKNQGDIDAIVKEKLMKNFNQVAIKVVACCDSYYGHTNALKNEMLEIFTKHRIT